jgi:hypothetical protein
MVEPRDKFVELMTMLSEEENAPAFVLRASLLVGQQYGYHAQWLMSMRKT